MKPIRIVAERRRARSVAVDMAMPAQPPMGAPRSMKVTLPLSGAGETPAVNVTALRGDAAFAEVLSVVLVGLAPAAERS